MINNPTRIDKTSPAGQAALAEFNTLTGFDISKVLSPDDWMIVHLDGRPEVVVSRNGVRGLALLSPNPRGQEIAEQVIRAGGAIRTTATEVDQ